MSPWSLIDACTSAGAGAVCITPSREEEGHRRIRAITQEADTLLAACLGHADRLRSGSAPCCCEMRGLADQTTLSWAQVAVRQPCGQIDQSSVGWPKLTA